MTVRKRVLTITAASAAAVLGVAGVATALPTVGVAAPWAEQSEVHRLMHQRSAVDGDTFERMHTDVESMTRHHDEMVERYPGMREHMGDREVTPERMREQTREHIGDCDGTREQLREHIGDRDGTREQLRGRS